MRDGKVALIMQARMGSTRLPGKSMMKLAGAPLVQRIIERVKRAKRPDVIVLATTHKPQDDVLCELAADQGIQVFRGSETDLVDRFIQAAKAFQADIIVRLPADNPVVEPAEIDRIIEHYLSSDEDFSSNTHNVFGNQYPDGLGAEVFSRADLERVAHLTSDPRNREHPHTFFYENPQIFKLGTVQCPPEFRRPDLVLDVNTQEEYEFIAAIYSYCYPRNKDFHITDIIQWFDTIYSKDHEKKGVHHG